MVGKVIGLTVDIIDIEFPKGSTPLIGTVLRSESGVILTTEIVLNDQVVRAVVVSQNANIELGEKITSTGKPLQAPVGDEILGRIFNVFGEPIDNLPVSPNQKYVDVEIIKTKNKQKEFIFKSKRIQTGIKVIDFFIPILEGDKLGMFGGAGVGKTLIIKELINNLVSNIEKSSSIFVGIGERSREGEELYRELREAKLIDQVGLVFAQMNSTPGARMKVIYSALTMAEYFRDVMKKSTYLFVDNIYRYIQAGSEVSSSLGRIPAQSGYQPTLASEVSIVQERIANSSNGTITAFETVFVPADDITDPAIVTIFSHLDGSLVLDRKIAADGKYPAINVLKSFSNNLNESVVGARHLKIATNVKKYLQRYEELADLLAILGQEGLSENDQMIVVRSRILQNYFTQNLFSSEAFTQRPGQFINLEQVIEETERIMSGEFDEINPADFLYLNSLDSLVHKLKKNQEIVESKKIKVK